jgi:hypothetical protein
MTNNKILRVMDAIEEQLEVTPSESNIFLHIDITLFSISLLELELILEKLKYDYGILNIIKTPNEGVSSIFSRGFPYYELKVNKDKFKEYYAKWKQENPPTTYSQNDTVQPSLSISYSEHNRKIIVNDFFILAHPDFTSENEQVFYYLYRHPNKLIKQQEIEEDIFNGETLTKNLSKIIENLNFKKELRKAFFDINLFSPFYA